MKYKIKKLKNHKDKRGFFAEFVKLKDAGFVIKQISIASIEPGEVRGNHYHEKKNEWFLTFGGNAEIFLADVKTNKIEHKKFLSENLVAINILPRMAHAIKNIDKHTIYFVEAESAEYNRKNPDAIPYKICDF